MFLRFAARFLSHGKTPDSGASSAPITNANLGNSAVLKGVAEVDDADADFTVWHNNSREKSPALSILVNGDGATGASSTEASMSGVVENVEGALLRQGGQESFPLNEEHPRQKVCFYRTN